MKKFFTFCAGLITLLFTGCHCRTTEVPQNAVLLDVRTEAEFAERHIPGSILIPHDKINSEISGKVPDKDTPIAVFCRSGRRSAIAKEKLEALGYNNVYNLGSLEDAAETLNLKIE